MIEKSTALAATNSGFAEQMQLYLMKNLRKTKKGHLLKKSGKPYVASYFLGRRRKISAEIAMIHANARVMYLGEIWKPKYSFR